MEEKVGVKQFGFRKGRGTGEVIGLVRMICGRYKEKGRGITYFGNPTWNIL